GHDLVARAARTLDAPAPLVSGVTHPFGFVLHRRPLVRAQDRGIVELLDEVHGRVDVEVEAPVGVVVVDVADAGRLGGREAEARPNLPVRVEAPLADIAVPAGLQLADEHDLLTVDVDADAEEVAGVRAGLHDRPRLTDAEPEARPDVLSG